MGIRTKLFTHRDGKVIIRGKDKSYLTVEADEILPIALGLIDFAANKRINPGPITITGTTEHVYIRIGKRWVRIWRRQLLSLIHNLAKTITETETVNT